MFRSSMAPDGLKAVAERTARRQMVRIWFTTIDFAGQTNQVRSKGTAPWRMTKVVVTQSDLLDTLSWRLNMPLAGPPAPAKEKLPSHACTIRRHGPCLQHGSWTHLPGLPPAAG
ncbi:MAG: hypothetical protein ACO305_06220, partial [Rubrivivax sp.]